MVTLGDTRIAFLPIEHLTFTGCHYRPSVADDTAIRDRLLQFLDANLNSWERN